MYNFRRRGILQENWAYKSSFKVKGGIYGFIKCTRFGKYRVGWTFLDEWWSQVLSDGFYGVSEVFWMSFLVILDASIIFGDVFFISISIK